MRAVLALLVLSVAAAYAVVTQLPEGSAAADPIAMRAHRPQEIVSIAIEGRGLPLAQLRDALTSHQGELVDRAKLDADRAALQGALVSRGYLAATVDSAVVTFDDAGAAFVTFAVRPGALFHLRAVTVTGPAAHAAGVVTLAPGEVAEADRIARARQSAADVLASRGKATVEAQLHIDTVAALVDVELATH